MSSYSQNDPEIRRLQESLRAARDREEVALQALRADGRGEVSAAYWAAHADVLIAERELAAARGEEYAEDIDFPVNWDTGAPLPHLLYNGRKAFLTFYVRAVDPKWDGSYVTLKDPGNAEMESLAIVEFNRCISAKMGSPNDEVFEGHPLSGKGMEGYTAQVVKNSRWLAELEAINSVHAYYDPKLWRTLHHYIFWFHDETFECVAQSFSVEQRKCSMSQLIDEVSRRLIGK